MKLHAPLLFPLLLTLTSAGCKSKHETNAEPTPIPATSAVALPAPIPTGPVVSCLNLPPKERIRLQVSTDRKTIYYLEVNREFHVSAERTDRYALVALDVASRTTKVIDDNVGFRAIVTEKGQVIFARSETGSTEYGTNRRLYVRDPNQSEPVLLSALKGKDVSDFIVDEKSATVYYEEDFKIYQVPLAGGKSKKVADGWTIDAVLEDGLLVRQLFDRRNLVRFDGKKGKEFKIKEDENFAGINNGFMILVAHDEGRMFLQAKPLEGGDAKDATKEIPLDRGIKSLNWGSLPQTERVIARYHNGSRVYRIQGVEAKQVFTSTGADLNGYAELENDSKAVLACHDTYGDGTCGNFDESDVCFIERAGLEDVVALPTRKVPTALKDVEEKLSVLTKEEEWAGAEMKFHVRDDGGYQLQLHVHRAGPTDVDELRSKARSLQTRVTELSGMPSLSVGIHFDAGFTGGTLWHEGTQRFYSFGGVTQAKLFDVKEFPLEIDTTIITGWDNSSCRGKLKNISDKPFENLTVECSATISYGPRKDPGKGKVAPAILPAGVEGQFATSPFDYSEYRTGGVRIIVKQGDKVLLPYNRYGAKKGKEFWDQAFAIHQASGFGYEGRRVEKDTVTAHLIAGSAFQKLDKGEQEKACTKVVDEIVKLKIVPAKNAKNTVLRIEDSEQDRFRWRYKDGQLTEIVE